jgi:ribA/ribD-fused uncharacterized protein
MPGRIESYIHSDATTPSKGGSLVEVLCKTDFGAKTPEFMGFCRQVAMLAYGFQAKNWDHLIELHPEIELVRQDVQKSLNEEVVVSQITIMSPTPEVPELTEAERFPGMKEYEKNYFFYGGVFSQWWPSEFTIDGVTYTHAEQYMMAEKARMFKDDEAFKRIMGTISPRKQKLYGRSVEGFNKAQWDHAATDIVYLGNKAKFTQNPDLLKELMATDGMLLVEASPTDTIWGIGLAEGSPGIEDRYNWRGTNWLGLVLTKLREDLKNS